MVLPTPLQPEQYRSTGLSVAFALMGLPLPPQLLQEQAAGQQSPLNFDVSVANPNSPGLANFQVRQQGDELTVGDPRDRMFRAGMDLSKPDRIQMGPEGVQVDNPKNDGMRSGMYDLVLTTPLRPEEYRRTGLSVAFSLLGLPLPPHLLS